MSKTESETKGFKELFPEPDPHTYTLVGNEIRRDDGFVVRLAPIRPEDMDWAKARMKEWK